MAELLKIATISTWLFVIIDKTKAEDKVSHIAHLILFLRWLHSSLNGGSATIIFSLSSTRTKLSSRNQNCWVIVYFISDVPPS